MAFFSKSTRIYVGAQNGSNGMGARSAVGCYSRGNGCEIVHRRFLTHIALKAVDSDMYSLSRSAPGTGMDVTSDVVICRVLPPWLPVVEVACDDRSSTPKVNALDPQHRELAIVPQLAESTYLLYFRNLSIVAGSPSLTQPNAIT